MNRKKRAPQERTGKLAFSPLLRYALILLLLTLLFEVVSRYAEPRMLPIKHVKIDAKIERVSVRSLKRRMEPYIKGFFSTNVMALKNEMLAEPFVDGVVIKRVWPDTILVSLTELSLVASWGGEKAVSSKGELVNVKINPSKHLPIFWGPDNQASKVLEVYNQLSATIRPLNLAISEIKLNMRHSWHVSLDNGIKLSLGRKDLASHLASFVAVYPKLKKVHGDHLESIDLRHSNGVSVHLLDSYSEGFKGEDIPNPT